MSANTGDFLAGRFEENRSHLSAVAYRMLGSLSEAEDAVQEAWLRLGRSDMSAVENLGGWLTTVVSRVCLDALRSRRSRREEPLSPAVPDPVAVGRGGSDPEREALLADSVGLALLVVLDRLTPTERIAFVLHDLFDVPFEEIGPIVGRSPAAARQLASRARRRVKGAHAVPAADPARRPVVEAFLAALQRADVDGLLAVLDPDLVVRVDAAASATGAPREVHGAMAWARGAVAFVELARLTRAALVDGAPGAIYAPLGKLARALVLTIADGKITRIEVVADAARLRTLDVAVLGS